ncbi:PEP-CTERM sorting domain-containing protein [Oceaniferula spumae]|uniref:PEP-CTERM sorting domain-containing protein n=1 Tax=Oceaniferula spumae TaxID=2979115 RepID=UPI003F4E541F
MKTRLLASACTIATLSSLSAATTILNPSADGTYFQVSAGTDERVNNDVGRAGRNDGNTFDFVGLIIFDISSFTTVDLNTATNITLTYSLGAQDNTPPLDQIQIEYIGTFADDTLGTNGMNGASATAIAMGAAPIVQTLFSGAASAGNNQTLDVTSISSDTFANQYAAFRFTDPNGGTHQWDIGDTTGTPTGTAIPAATLSITPVPEPSSVALLGLGGLALILRRRK